VSPKAGVTAILTPNNSQKRKGKKMDEKELQAYRESNEFKEKDKEARKMVEEHRLYFRDNPLQIITPKETTDNILHRMKFQPTHINYVTNTVTFTLVE